MGMSGSSGTSSGSVVHYSTGTSTSGTPPVSLMVAPGTIDVSKLSISELMQWVSTQLNKTDTDLRAQMKKMTNAKDQQAAVSKLIEVLKKGFADAKEGKLCAIEPDPRLTDAYKHLSKEGKAAIDTLLVSGGASPGVPMDADVAVDFDGEKLTPKEALAKGFAFVDSDGEIYRSIGLVDKDCASATIDAMKEELSATTSSNEMDMIKLQSAISARGQMIQLVSNMIHQMDETSKAIVGNVR